MMRLKENGRLEEEFQSIPGRKVGERREYVM
jgi:hypothetical protein